MYQEPPGALCSEELQMLLQTGRPSLVDKLMFVSALLC